ncbi:valine--tRNA ligase-like isoform X2 [Physella acuta]|nr:valine--tRNA ligase-like isoform X2 [Physella acuta]
MSKTFSSKEIQNGWYEWWEQQGYFRPRMGDGETFSLLLPPPNVTGNLHLGHALTCAVQDAIVRWHRMKGHKTLWIPGTDHAGIATHAVVERKLLRETGKSRHDIGREKFLQEIWKWKERHGHVISQQLKTLGMSLDWSKEYFTMDEALNSAVTQAFCILYDKGLIYRDKRMINWSSALRSSLSDIEVDNVTVEGPTVLKVPGVEGGVEVGVLAHFAYPVADSEERLVVATSRLETMLADTAVAVNPADGRFTHLIGRRLVHPLVKDRLIPVIADSFVDMNFGTGAVKITPGHDPVDYEVGRRHNLPDIDMFNDDGTVKMGLPLVGGQNRFLARQTIKEALSVLGLYCGQSGHATTIPVCSRSGDIVEPRLKDQWFLDCRSLSQRAIQVVESKQLKIFPDYNKAIWSEFLNKTMDWCLSRQLWWGHRIPVYTCTASKQRTCAMSEEEAKKKLNSSSVTQDEDVLDTWFSSSLLPFTSLGWPQQTLDLEQYFPQQMLETGQDIMFFWVARMVMMSLELTGKLPFHEILLHGMVRDSQGRKMSKSLGNVIDPLDVVHGITLEALNRRLEDGNFDPREVSVAREGQRKEFPNGIAACGVDALRFTLCSYNFKNMNVNFDVMNAESKMRFCNKIWQSFKFIFSKLPADFSSPPKLELTGAEDGTDLWVLSRLSHLVKVCNSSFLSHDLHHAVGALQYFWYQELCDVYLEAVKPVFNGADVRHQETVQHILYHCAETFVLAAAPFMPFLCEELFQRLPARQGRAESICVAPYPQPEQFTWYNCYLDTSMAKVEEIVNHALRLRKDYSIMGTRSKLYIQSDSVEYVELLAHHGTCLQALSRSDHVTLVGTATPLQGCASVFVTPDLSVLVDLKGCPLDIAKEVDRLKNKVFKLENEKSQVHEKLVKIISKNRGDTPQALRLQSKIASLDTDIKSMSAMMDTFLQQSNVVE